MYKIFCSILKLKFKLKMQLSIILMKKNNIIVVSFSICVVKAR